MKAVGTSLVAVAGLTAGMVAGACLAMSQPCVKRMYRYGKKAAKHMMHK